MTPAPGVMAMRETSGLSRTRRRLRHGLMAMLLVAMLPMIEAEENVAPLVVAVCCVLLSELLRWRRPHRPLPAAIVALMALTSVAFLMSETVLSSEPAPPVLALGHFVVLLACCKLFEPMRDRDFGLLLVIVMLLLVIGGLVSGSLAYGLALGGGLTLGVAWLIRFQQLRDAVDASDRNLESGDVVSVTLSSGEAPRVRIGAGPSLGIGAGMLLIAVATFVVMPRGLSRQLFGRLRAPIAAAVTGYREQVEPLGGGAVESEVPVLRVRLSRGGRAFGSADLPLYLRGRTMATYAQGRWMPRPKRDGWRVAPSPLDDPTVLSAALSAAPPDSVVRQEVWLDPTYGPNLFALAPPLAASAGEAVAIEQACDDLTLRVRRYVGQALHYVAISPLRLTPRMVEMIETEYALRAVESDLHRGAINTTRVPAPGPRSGDAMPSDIPPGLARTARELTRGLGDPADPASHEQLAGRISEYFRSGAFDYTLEAVAGYGPGDRVEQFVLVTRRGHCEFFASAMALMCQAIGVPARLATGYVTDEYNPVGSFYIARQRDAHAWVEVYLPGRGWTIFDPSPPAAARGRGGRDSVFAAIGRLAHYLQFEWATLVVSFDAEYRRRIFGTFEGWFRRIDESSGGLAMAAEIIKAFIRGPPELAPRQRVLYWVMLALGLLLTVLILHVLWRLLLIAREFLPRRFRPGDYPRAADARFYDRLLMLLERRGFRKPPTLTPAEFAEHVAQRAPNFAPVIDLTRWFYDAQYGQRTLSPAQRGQVREFLRFVREGPPLGMRPPLAASSVKSGSPQD